MLNLLSTLGLFILASIISLSRNGVKGQNKSDYYICFFILIFVLVAFREGKSLNDYNNYIDLYNSQIRDGEVEYSFYIIRDFSKKIGDINVLFLIYALLCVGIKFISFYRLTNLLFLTLVVYISNIMLLHDMTQIRAGVASGIFLYSVPYLERQEKIKYLLCVLAATFFHNSGLLFFLPCLYWVKAFRNTKFLLPFFPFVYVVGGTIFDISNFPIESIRLKLQMYVNLQASQSFGLKDLNIFNPYILFRISLYYLLLWKKDAIAQNNKYFNCLIFIEAIALFIFPAFSSIAILGYRGSELLGIVEVVLYPMLYYAIKPKTAAKFSVISIAAALLIVNLTYKHLIYF